MCVHTPKTSDTDKKSNTNHFPLFLIALILFADDKIHQVTVYISKSYANDQDHIQI